MRYVIAFFKFWRNFLIGDDVWGALIGLAGFAGTWALVRSGVVAWWLLPVAAVVSVAFSVWRKVRAARLAGAQGAARQPAAAAATRRAVCEEPATEDERAA